MEELEEKLYCDEFILYVNNTFGHKFIRSFNIKYINDDHSKNIFVCTICNSINHIWSINIDDFDCLLYNNMHYVIYNSIDENDFEFMKNEDLISCNEKMIKNLLE